MWSIAMRNIVVGVLLGGALAAAACTPGHYDHPPASAAPQSSTPEQAAAAAVKPGFVGEQQIGAWTLVCKSMLKNALPPAKGAQPAQTGITENEEHKARDINLVDSASRCSVTAILEEADKPERRTVARFELRGASGVLYLLFRAREELFPLDAQISPQARAHAKRSETGKPSSAPVSDNSSPELVELNYAGRSRSAPLIGCGPNACFARIEIPQEDEPGFLAAKDVVLELPAFPGKSRKRVSLPVPGLADAIGAMRRLEE
jgi:invasion protein IalB